VVTANFVPTDSANYNSLLALSAGNFVIGKATPTATLWYLFTTNLYRFWSAATVTISASSVPGEVSNILPEEQQLKLMREPMSVSQLRSYGLSYYNSLLLFQQGIL
jgi:hypothetical protein